MVRTARSSTFIARPSVRPAVSAAATTAEFRLAVFVDVLLDFVLLVDFFDRARFGMIPPQQTQQEERHAGVRLARSSQWRIR
jgi:hypothetical protein